jgi:hypothetical protein
VTGPCALRRPSRCLRCSAALLGVTVAPRPLEAPLLQEAPLLPLLLLLHLPQAHLVAAGGTDSPPFPATCARTKQTVLSALLLQSPIYWAKKAPFPLLPCLRRPDARVLARVAAVTL